MNDLARDWYGLYAAPNLADNTLIKYRRILTKHLLPKLGGLKISEVTPEVVARFRADLEREGVGRDSVRTSLVVLQSIYRHGVEWGRAIHNPAMSVRKPSAKRVRAVRPYSPNEVEAVRAELPLGDATLVSVVAYAGLRCPEEVLALEWGHVGERTLLVEQRNIDGQILPGQKVRGAGPRSVDLTPPLKQDLATWRLRCGRPSDSTLVFPRYTASRGDATTGRTGDGGRGTRRSSARGCATRRPTTSGTRSRRFRSAPEHRFRSSPSSSVTRRR